MHCITDRFGNESFHATQSMAQVLIMKLATYKRKYSHRNWPCLKLTAVKIQKIPKP